MTNAIPSFSDLSFSRPDEKCLQTRYALIEDLLDQGQREEGLKAFDQVRREYESWSSYVHLQFSRNTQDEQAKADQEYADKLTPIALDYEIKTKKRLLSDADRSGLERILTPHVVKLWEADVTTFDARIAQDIEEESRLTAEYTALLASAQIEFDGKTLNLSGLVPYLQSLDRDVRHAAARARWAFFEENGEKLDYIYAQLVTLRDRMAQTLGFENYIELGYRRMRRTDYGPKKVASFRERILKSVTPFIAALLEQRRLRMGWDKVRAWDEDLIDPKGNPAPGGDHDFLVKSAEDMFKALDPEKELSDFYIQMRDLGYLDLQNREGKAGGGFCTSFPTVGSPYIFANFNGTHNDIGVFTHEMGHAFQNWKSRDLTWIDQLWPTMESAEIHSMSLEFLTWPQIDLLIEKDAGERYRQMHLIDSLAFFPYGACVDHFQHEVYAHPEMTAQERHQTWARLEKMYMPWRDWGDLAYPSKGARWQAQLHIYRLPFYYIDYALAQCCALQFWLQSRVDMSEAFERYRQLCAEGGSKPFSELVKDAGLISPFEEEALMEALDVADQELNLAPLSK
ncbi:M3 family oligoendopeptidase [Swingsia samuiensis]|uniref:M3 family oligoendopeptidase n=1 Tax=Swingsia samuiensis TaxID=1293412 RepID=A0A4Y6UI15_9PROT|nr:M3 family oligoendopeptidase [Swingsia samuiensis]QDH16298.1 M3 family oligoendopeptidase [Swingsia samuiensis]